MICSSKNLDQKHMEHESVDNMKATWVSGLQQKLAELDLYLRPQLLIVNPSDYKIIIDAIPDIETKVLLVTNPTVEQGKIYLIDRKALENYYNR